MSSAGDKQFDATPSRIAKARREGNVARSQEAAANAAFIAGALAVIAFATHLGGLAQHAIALAARGIVPWRECIAIALCGLGAAAAAAGAGACVALVQNGGVHVAPVSLKFDRLNPVEGLKRMLSRETLLHALRAAAAFVIAACAIVPALRDICVTAVSSGAPQRVAAAAWSGAQHVVFAAAAVGGAFAIAEYGTARRAWLEKLKMSWDELKREIKEHDGDPFTRGRRRALHRSFARGAIAKVKEASFVVVNPTHVAVAMQYRPPEIPVPLVLVRAADAAAVRVRELARESGIPIIEDVPLARALYRDAEAGAPIPHNYYVAVAEIVAALSRAGALS